jgi:hypothetical protein
MKEKAVLLFTHRDRKTTTSRRTRASARFRPAVDGLEGRALLSAVASMGGTVAQVTPITSAQTQTVPVFQVQNGQLVATVTLNSQSFTVPVSPAVSTTSLTLTIGPTDQSARGLRVQAAAFPVTITPQDDQPLAVTLRSIIAGQQGGAPNLTTLASGLNDLISQAESLNAQTGSGSVLSLTGVSVQGGQLVTTGTLLGQSFTRTVAVGTSPGTSPRRPNLTLTLAEGDDVRQGLRVQTKVIPLTVSAQPGRNTRLGTLLVQVTRQLARNPNLSPRLVSRVLAQLQR